MDAKEDCEDLNGHLPTYEDSDGHQVIYSLLASSHQKAESYNKEEVIFLTAIFCGLRNRFVVVVVIWRQSSHMP